MRFKKRNKIISIVDNEMLFFVELTPRGERKAVESVNLADLLIDNVNADALPFSVRYGTNKLLIVPDYWFGNFVYKFQSSKKSLTDAFVERKLHAQFPQLPEVKFFYDSISSRHDPKDRLLYAYFLQDHQFFQLYKKLSRLGLKPHRITSPALIWGSKIRQKLTDFSEGGKCLIELKRNIYHLYFFFEGNFLFSRSIPLADLSVDSPDNLQAITYELNQSLYLFSQRAKAEVDSLYLLSSETLPLAELSEALGREIKDLGSLFAEFQGPKTGRSSTDPTDGFGPFHLLLKNQFLFLSHKKLKQEMEWRPVQTAGAAIALSLCFLLGLESVYLHKLSRQDQLTAVGGNGVFAMETKQKIQLYNEALDTLIQNAERRSPGKIIAKIAGSLPADIRMQEISLNSESPPSVDLTGVAGSLGPDRLKDSLSALLANLNRNLNPRKALAMPDIDIELDQNKESYLIKLKVEL